MESQETLMMETDTVRFPIGMFEFGKTYTQEDVQQFIKRIEELPAKLKKAVTGLTKDHLEISYREGGWSIRQVVHHIADSHLNAHARFRLALTEDLPVIKPYDQTAWAELEDARTAPIEWSLELLVNLHKRWAMLLKSMDEQDFDRMFYHPEHQMSHRLTEIVAMYAWHGDHHLAHIQLATTLISPVKPKAVKKPAVKKAVKKKVSK